MIPETPIQVDAWAIEGSITLLVVILGAGLGTGVLFVISVIASVRRGGTQFRLITVAVGALFVRSLVGIGTVFGVVPMWIHHFVEHSLDFLIAATVLYAVYAHAPGAFRDENQP